MGTRHRCSREQEGLWLLEQTRDIGSANNVPIGLLLRGALDVATLTHALEVMVARHAALRTVLAVADGRAARREHDASAVPRPGLEVLVARSGSDTERLIAEQSHEPLDPTRWPPFRFVIVRRASDEHVLLMVFHHCLFDGASADTTLREVAQLYAGLLEGRAVDRTAIPSRYDRFVADEEQAMLQLGARAASYWEPRLAAIGDSVRIPVETQAGGDRGASGGHVDFEIDGEAKDRLNAFAHEHGASLFTALLAVIQVLQYRYAGSADGRVATAVAMDARPREMRDAIGMFANEAPLLSTPASELTFLRFLGAVRDGARELFELRRFPFTETLARFGQPASREARAQIGVTYIRTGRRDHSIPRLEVEPLGILPNYASRRPLMLYLFDHPRGLRARLDFDPSSVSLQFARGMAHHFRVLVSSVLERSEATLGELELLRPDERRRIVVEWSEGESVARARATVAQLVEQQVRRTPYAAAIELRERSLTYAELNAGSNRLAHRLVRLGAAADVPVALCVERSFDLVIGLLAILKAGAAYVPLDADQPRERLRLMLENARPAILITRDSLRRRLPDTRSKLLLLDREAEEIGDQPTHDPATDIAPSSLAYIIYTSGSTGVPKGVAMSNDALVNLLEWQRRSFTHTRPVRTLQFASAGFDVAFQEIFSTLTTGGCVVLIDEHLRRDFEELAALVDEARIERLFMPFPSLNELVRHLGRRPVGAAEVEVITAGERLDITPQIRDLWRRRPHWTLTNQYGPTETHVVTAHQLPRRMAADWPALPPIGRPIANARVYVLDAARQPVPPGVPGELYVGGRCLARGYHRDPKATSERFVPDPFRAHGSRLYRTGDVVRWRASGVLEFLGRTDDQVKVRGFRVELGEIETCLAQHPAVRSAAVIAEASGRGGVRLVAYLVPLDGCTVESRELEEHSRRLLPDYMVPAVFVPLSSLPLTANGKLDRRALPVPPEQSASAETYVAPRSRTERLLAETWAEVLGLGRVGMKDDFFALGGHSLLAGELVARARARLKRDIPIGLLFSGPTIAQMAAALDQPAARSRVDRPSSASVRRPLREVLAEDPRSGGA